MLCTWTPKVRGSGSVPLHSPPGHNRHITVIVPREDHLKPFNLCIATFCCPQNPWGSQSTWPSSSLALVWEDSKAMKSWYLLLIQLWEFFFSPYNFLYLRNCQQWLTFIIRKKNVVVCMIFPSSCIQILQWLFEPLSSPLISRLLHASLPAQVAKLIYYRLCIFSIYQLPENPRIPGLAGKQVMKCCPFILQMGNPNPMACHDIHEYYRQMLSGLHDWAWHV